jgi:predicted nucleic acid-binding protein
MNVLVDTSVWSLALRRRTSKSVPHVVELGELIREGRVSILGPIRQELLSGTKSTEQFERLREHLEPFSDLELVREDYEDAARAFNTCRVRGLQASNTDFLICAVALNRDLAIFTTDRDFDRLSGVLKFRLHQARSSPG